jgi:hypothetical protein
MKAIAFSRRQKHAASGRSQDFRASGAQTPRWLAGILPHPEKYPTALTDPGTWPEPESAQKGQLSAGDSSDSSGQK